jgi:hypothetical protein
MTSENIRPAINKSVLLLYRLFAVVSLYAVLAGVLAFGLGCAFYATSRTWIAPVILSKADKDALDLTGKALITQNSVDDLKLDIGKLEITASESQQHKAALEKLLPAIDAAIARENRHRRETGPILANLDEQKRSDDFRTQRVLEKLAVVDATIDKELAAGLITKGDATQESMILIKSNGDLTDSKIATTLLKDTIWDKTVPTTTYLDTLHRKAELESEIAVLGIVSGTARKQAFIEKGQVSKFNEVLNAARQTPLWAAMQSGRADVALVPYENQAVAKAGSPVYDCYLSFVVCRQVGLLKAVFSAEQRGIHPIFRTDIRGFLVQLELSNPESAKSKTLFLGRKPLLF